jgi:hypothetical protein
MATSVLIQTTPGGSPYYATQSATATNAESLSQSNSNFCGDYQCSISRIVKLASLALSLTELTIDSLTGIISLYTANSVAIGTHTATVSAKLVNYAALPIVTATFTITIQPCLVTSFSMNAPSPSHD